ncbi:LysR family transcriptional regulator [Salibacterium aidingense]|uniref:LysR family transcriptional regulator n=1 Tax=Salibacterium aidingense TaxID=384933 RepID=UPI003BC64D9B
MNEQDWSLLHILNEEKNITRAAQRLYISQPALTYRLNHLEKEFGTKLVLREKKGLEFTPEGEHLLQYAKKMIHELQKTKDEVLNMGEHINGNLRLGTSGHFALYRLPDILKDFLRQYSQVQLNVHTGLSSEIMSLMEQSEVHLGIVRGEILWQGKKHLLSEENLCVISKEPLQLKELVRLPMISYTTDISLKHTIDSWWKQEFNQPPFVMMQVDRIETCKEMVKNGLGFAIIPRIGLRASDPLYAQDINAKSRKTWLIYDERALKLSVVQVFADFIRSYFHPPDDS